MRRVTCVHWREASGAEQAFLVHSYGSAPCQFAVKEKKEREHTAGIGVFILQKRSIGTLSDSSVSIHIEISIYYY